MDPDEHLPVFVYGTLLQGEANADQVAGRMARVEPGRLPRHRLYLLEYPCAVPDDGLDGRLDGGAEPSVLGEIVWLRDDGYADHLAHLDWFEQHRPEDPEGSLYVREVRAIERVADDPDGPAPGASVRCWVYLAGPPMVDRVSAGREVRSGDWRTARG